MNSRRATLWLFAVWLSLLPVFVTAAEVLPRAEGSDFRAVVWNVSRHKFFDQHQDYLVALRAIDADLLIFDEMPGDRNATDVVAVLENLKSETGVDWQVAYGSSGHNQRVVVALRGKLKPVRKFMRLPYPPSFVTWMRRLKLTPEQRARMDENLNAGIGAFAVEADIGGRRILTVGVDLQCCGDRDDAWEERRRLLESRIIRSLLNRVWTQRSPDAVIVAGDFNAVRGMKPVELMQASSGQAGRRLEVAVARHANGVDAWTWDGRGTPFPSRAIDFMLHSRSLRVLQALVFDAETMSESQRARYGLDVGMFRSMSEHRPVVVDFAWR